MPATAFLSPFDVDRIRIRLILDDPRIVELLSEVNRLVSQQWICEVKEIARKRIWRAPIIVKKYTVYIDCHGEWQIFNFPGGYSVSAETILAFLMGYRNGLTESGGAREWMPV